jgi:hypothetical protein
MSISAEGFVAGPHQSEENPLGEGGERVHGSAGRGAARSFSAGPGGGGGE